MLKKLDELMHEVVAGNLKTLEDWFGRWTMLRAEIGAERCDNCMHWHLHRLAWNECVLLSNHATRPDFCCDFFSKRKFTP